MRRTTKDKAVKIFVISGPGGAGKTTLISRLFCDEGIKDSCLKGITITTRPQRPQEKEGKDYFFVSKEEFLRLKKKKFFLESQQVLENYYGTPKIFYTLARHKNKNLVIVIDVKGGMYLKRNFKAAKIVTVFIAAPNEKELYQRMKKRAEAKGIMQERVKLAKKELQFSKYYDYVVTNKTIASTVEELKGIILSQQ
jgi:guanylate kinase